MQRRGGKPAAQTRFFAEEQRAWCSGQAAAGGDHRRPPGMHDVDDLGGVDALQTHRRHAEITVTELALDHVQRHALAGHLHRACARSPATAAGRALARSLSTTVAPRAGLKVMLRRRIASGAEEPGAISKRCRAARSTIFISSSAKLAPRHLRRPPPNGIHA